MEFTAVASIWALAGQCLLYTSALCKFTFLKSDWVGVPLTDPLALIFTRRKTDLWQPVPFEDKENGKIVYLEKIIN
jgi:hypothetical protein